MGLLGGIFNDRLPGNQGRSQHNVDGGAHADHVQTDTTALQAQLAGTQGHIVLGLLHIRTQRHKALDMLIDGTGSEITAARQGNIGASEPAQQHAHEVIAGTHFPNQIGIRMGIGDIRAIDDHNIGTFFGDLCAHSLQNVQKDPYIGNIRHIFNTAYAVHQQGCRQDRNSSIFRTADGN